MYFWVLNFNMDWLTVPPMSSSRITSFNDFVIWKLSLDFMNIWLSPFHWLLEVLQAQPAGFLFWLSVLMLFAVLPHEFPLLVLLRLALKNCDSSEISLQTGSSWPCSSCWYALATFEKFDAEPKAFSSTSKLLPELSWLHTEFESSVAGAIRLYANMEQIITLQPHVLVSCVS